MSSQMQVLQHQEMIKYVFQLFGGNKYFFYFVFSSKYILKYSGTIKLMTTLETQATYAQVGQLITETLETSRILS